MIFQKIESKLPFVKFFMIYFKTLHTYTQSHFGYDRQIYLCEVQNDCLLSTYSELQRQMLIVHRSSFVLFVLVQQWQLQY